VRDGEASDVAAMGWSTSESLLAAWRAQARRAATEEVTFLVAVADGKVVGKAVLDWTHRPGSAWLWMFSVDPQYRSRGIGSRVIVEAEMRARERGCDAVELAVDDDNPRALDLYVRQGYTVIGPYLDEYEVPEPDGTSTRVTCPGVLLRKEVGSTSVGW
jgi:ribosomal protein S18 acetylase RimI-like enzyme